MIRSVKSAVSLRAVLQEAGITLNHDKGLCPFHPDNHPSLTLKGERWKCWSCGEGGDVIDFIAKHHGLDFKGALKFLGAHTGIKQQTPAETRTALETAKRRKAEEDSFRSWCQRRSNDLASFIRLYRERVTQGFTEEELDDWTQVILRMPELEYEYEVAFCSRDGEAFRRHLFEEEKRLGRCAA